MKDSVTANERLVLEDGTILDYLTQKTLKETPKERVRQEVIRALFNEYQISLQDMEADFHLTYLNSKLFGGRHEKELPEGGLMKPPWGLIFFSWELFYSKN